MKQTIAVLSLVLMLLGSTTFAMADQVYVTKSGKKFHKETCALIKNKNKSAIDQAAAEAKGLQACKKCFKAEQVAKAENTKQ